ncbi:MAG: chlorophyll synthase ChlG [Roseococcus sp.]
MSGRVMPNPAGRLDPAAVLELFKPVTWFPPVWAFLCGAVSAGAPFSGKWGLLALGLLLAGPMVCATSQAVNDWFDRHVDAINEPDRPIPSGRIPGRWGLWIAIFWSGVSLLIGAALGPWGFGATVLALLLAWAYSAPPLRLKRNGWLGCAATGLSYETLPWITAAAIMAGGAPRPEILLVALLYGLGAHGIMTLNDFKAIEGDRRTGIASLPVLLGPERAALLACWVMAVPQLAVVVLLLAWGAVLSPIIILALLGVQAWAMRRMMTDPRRLAPWYNAAGVGPYVLGMLAAAFALRGLA